MRDRVSEVLPPRTEALTGQQLADSDSGDIKSALSFFSTFLLVFAAIAIFVGSFIIFNTFSMLVAQRSRELALLRALGASRRQVNRAVIVEAAVVGVIGSTIGLGLGVLLSIGLQQLIGLFLGDLPTDGLVFQGSTVLWAYLIGVVVTVVSAIAAGAPGDAHPAGRGPARRRRAARVVAAPARAGRHGDARPRHRGHGGRAGGRRGHPVGRSRGARHLPRRGAC